MEEILEMNEVEKNSEKIIKDKENSNYDFGIHYTLSIILTMFVFLILIPIYYEVKNNVVRVLYFIFFITVTLFLDTFPFIYYINKKIRLKKDKEYQLAKKVIKKYNEKLKRKELEEIINKEKEKSNTILEMEKYLKEDN